jgi:thiamine-monophosphate kinase
VLHLCRQSELGAVLYEDKIPVHQDARDFAYTLDLDPTACALSGGEDYELLFTIAQADYDKVKDADGISVIGYMTEEKKTASIITRGGNEYPITAQGWNAFK